MATLAAIRDLRYDVIFRNKIEGALLVEAIGAFQELSSVTNHAQRVVYAKIVILNTAEEVDKVAAILSGHSSIQNSGNTTTDATIQTAVGQCFNFLAV